MYSKPSSKIIIVEGIPGCGKTTFCKSYASSCREKDVVIMEEWVDEKILANYISDMKNKATSFQYEAQRQSAVRLHKAFELANLGKTVLIDRSLMGNRCFAEVQFEAGYILHNDMEVYRKTFTYETILSEKERRNVQMEVWYLQCDVDTALGRIKQRNRNGESAYSAEYLTKLKMKHDELLLTGGAKIIDANKTLKISLEGLMDVQHLIEVF